MSVNKFLAKNKVAKDQDGIKNGILPLIQFPKPIEGVTIIIYYDVSRIKLQVSLIIPKDFFASLGENEIKDMIYRITG